MDAKTQSQGSTEELAGSLPKENRDREKPSPMGSMRGAWQEIRAKPYLGHLETNHFCHSQIIKTGIKGGLMEKQSEAAVVTFSVS